MTLPGGSDQWEGEEEEPVLNCAHGRPGGAFCPHCSTFPDRRVSQRRKHERRGKSALWETGERKSDRRSGSDRRKK